MAVFNTYTWHDSTILAKIMDIEDVVRTHWGLRRVLPGDVVIQTENPTIYDVLSEEEWNKTGYSGTSITRPIDLSQFEDASLLVNESVQITVGNDGDYSTINSALEDITRLKPSFIASGLNVELRLLSGFVMQEQVFVSRLDLGWIFITAEDTEVTIARSALVNNDQSGDQPAFYGNENAILPVIATRFNMDTSGVANSQIGCRVSNGSGIVFRLVALAAIRPGIINCTQRGLNVQQGAWAVFNSADFSGAGNVGIRLGNGSHGQGSNAIATNCGDAGASIASSTIDLGGADLSNCVNGMGLRADNGSAVAFYDAKANNCATYGVYAIEGSIVGARNLSATGCGSAGIYADGSVVQASSAILTGGATNGIHALNSATVGAALADVRNSANAGVLATHGAVVNINHGNATGCYIALQADNGATVNGAGVVGTSATLYGGYAYENGRLNVRAANLGLAGTNGIRAQRGSFVNAQGATTRKNADGVTDAPSDTLAMEGSIINAGGITGGNSPTANGVTAAGIIFR